MTCEWPKVEGYVPSSVVNFFREMTEPGDFATPAALVEQAYTRWCRLNAERASILHRYVHCLQLILESDEYRGFRLKDPDPGPDPRIHGSGTPDWTSEYAEFLKKIVSGDLDLRQIRGGYSQQRVAALATVSQAYVSFFETRRLDKLNDNLISKLTVAYLQLSLGKVPPDKIDSKKRYRVRERGERMVADAPVSVAGGPAIPMPKRRGYRTRSELRISLGTCATEKISPEEMLDMINRLSRRVTRRQFASIAGVSYVSSVHFMRGEVWNMFRSTVRKMVNAMISVLKDE